MRTLRPGTHLNTFTYFSARARHLTPSVVAKGAARRALRTARQLLYRRAQYARIGDAELLTSLGAAGPADLAITALRPHPDAWCDVSQREQVLRALSMNPDAVSRARARADAAVARRFRIFEQTLSFGAQGPLEWSLDPGSGYRFPQAPSTSLDLTPPGVDPKYPWQLGRLEAAVALGQGYWVAANPEQARRYAFAFVALATDFIRANPPNLGIHWTNPMEVSLRAANLAQALFMMRDAPPVQDPSFLMDLLRSLSEHTAYVEANLEDRGLVPNNHLIADYVGLLIVTSLLPGLPGAGGQRALALRGLRTQIPAQVFVDGVSFEGSTGYHRLVAELCVMATVCARAFSLELGAEAIARTHGLLRVAAAWTSQNGLAPQIGDNDSGRALSLTDRRSLDHGYLADLGAVLFADGGLKSSAGPLADEALWLFGEKGARSFAPLPAAAGQAPRSFCSNDGGLHVLRGGGAVVTVSAGPMGQRGAGGHSHNDKLSFELHLHGVPVIVDPGSPVYARDPAARNRFRGSAAHNALVLDEAEQSELDASRLFALADGAGARVETFEAGEALDRLVATHRGYERLEQPVTVRRELVLDKRDCALIVEESLQGQGAHRLALSLQLPDEQVRLRGPRGTERMKAPRLMGGRAIDETIAIELGPKDAPRAVILMEPGFEVSLEQSPTATGYGEVQPAVKIVLRTRAAIPWRRRWMVLFA